jgi:predicted Mrr-cat superfamily restriction endonuclease
MNSIYVITTHHEKPNEAAEAWKKIGICAIGWARYGNLKKPKYELTGDAKIFLEIEKGDLVLAYATKNKIALVGEVTSEYCRNTENLVGKDEGDGGFGYPNQYEVNWFKEPFDFDRKDLPQDLWSQIGKRGRTVVKLELHRRNFEQVKQIILTNPISGGLSEKGREDLIKAGLLKYLKNEINSLEKGLVITDVERQIENKNRPDFIARDINGRKVIIECKGTAEADVIDQIARYRKNYSKDARILLIAFSISNECKKALKQENVELIECDLIFKHL